MNRIRIFLTNILLFVSLAASSQSIYPVQVNAFAIKHNLRYLSDYYSGTEEPLSVTLLNRDTQQPEIQVKLKLTIRTSDGLVLTTKNEAWFPAISLESGIPERLTMQELASYFFPKNLNASGSFVNERLTGERCEFRFEALDYYTGRVLSAVSMAAVQLNDLKPPVLQQPLDKQYISFSEPLNMTFSWVPSSNINTFGKVEYEFTLKEIMDKQADVNAAFLYAPTIYTEKTTSTSLAYNANFPPLEPNKRYAWQVRASLPDETSNKNRFENNGLSKVFYFDLREDCQAPLGVKASTDRGKISVSWSPVIGASKYAVKYRRKDFDTDQWHDKFTDETELYITDIALGNEYAYQVGTVCSDGKVVYGYTAYIKVPLVDSAQMAKCGIMPEINISNTTPKDMLKAGDKIMAGDFPVTLTQVSGGNGTFSGEGYSTLPYLGAFRLAVKFENIGVNEENKLISGFIESKYDESAGGIYNADALTEGGITSLQTGIIKPDITVNYIFPPVPTIEYDAAANVMSFEDGAHQPIGNLQVPKNEQGEPVFPFTVQDASNTVYQVDEEIDPATGQPTGKFKFTKLGQQQAPIAEGSIDENLLDYNIGLITFENTENSKYTLDGFLPYYDNVSIIRYNSNMNDDRLYPEVAEDYHVQWKFIPEGASDQVMAKLQIGKDNKIDPAKVIFKSKTGTVFEKIYNEKDNTFTVTLSGAQADSRQDVFALHPSDEDGKYWNFGKLYIDTRAKPQAFKVVLVNLGGEYNKEDISSGLNEIYNKVGVSWQVEEYNDFTTTEDLENLYDKSSGLLSAYNDKMKAINTALIEKLGDEYDPAACYVLMMRTGNVDKKDRNVTGFMPRGNQFCYIYTAKMDNLAAGIAHELGHGKFKLKHTFDSGYGNAAEATKGTTDNLMDYSSPSGRLGGASLTKWQWDEIYNPAILNALFDGDGEGMIGILTSSQKIKVILHKIRKRYGSDRKVDITTEILRSYNITVGNQKFDRIIIQSKDNQPHLDVNPNNVDFDVILTNRFTNETNYGFLIDNKLYVLVSSLSQKELLKKYLFDKTLTDDYIPVFSKIDYNSLINSINERKLNSNKINQSSTPLCGIACIANIMATHDKNGYANLVEDLYYYGKAYYDRTNYLVDPFNLLSSDVWEKGPEDDDYPYFIEKDKTITKMPVCDYILLTSLKSSLSGTYSGDHGSENISGITTPSTMIELCKNLLGMTEIEDKTNLVSSGGDFSILKSMDQLHSQGFNIILLVHPKLLGQDDSKWVRHWVLYKENNLTFDEVNEKYKFALFSWGTTYNISIVESYFKSNFYGYIKAKW